jgi:hypothetical protein
MSPTSKTKDEAEDRGTLPVGHPEAGYVSPDLSTHEGTGTLPPEEIEWHEARNDAHDEEVENVAAHEAEVEKRERDERAKRDEDAQKAKGEQSSSKPQPKPSASSPSGSS